VFEIYAAMPIHLIVFPADFVRSGPELLHVAHAHDKAVLFGSGEKLWAWAPGMTQLETRPERSSSPFYLQVAGHRVGLIGTELEEASGARAIAELHPDLAVVCVRTRLKQRTLKA